MRLIHTFKNIFEGKKFSEYLTSKNIQNLVETETNKDWGSPDYGETTGKLWIVEEDQFLEASSMLHKFLENSDAKEFNTYKIPLEETSLFSETNNTSQQSFKKPPPDTSPPPRSLTLYLIILCCLVFAWSQFTTPSRKDAVKYIPATIQFSPQINKDLFYDYPNSFETIDKIKNLYTHEQLEDLNQLPISDFQLLKKELETPYWTGIYNYLTDYFKGKKTELDTSQMFQKIREGEVWRTVTPIFLHYDFLHILFNMLWIYILGIQMEKKLGGIRYLFFILLGAIIPNTAQYLMSGFNFMGISGVVCAMITFIWTRTQIAPWEGYQLEKSTFYFISLFVLLFFAVQLLSFIAEITGLGSYSFGLANTAHLAGALVGFILGRWKKLLIL